MNLQKVNESDKNPNLSFFKNNYDLDSWIKEQLNKRKRLREKYMTLYFLRLDFKNTEFVLGTDTVVIKMCKHLNIQLSSVELNNSYKLQRKMSFKRSGTSVWSKFGSEWDDMKKSRPNEIVKWDPDNPLNFEGGEFFAMDEKAYKNGTYAEMVCIIDTDFKKLIPFSR